MSRQLNETIIDHVQNAISELSLILQELTRDNAEYDRVKKISPW